MTAKRKSPGSAKPRAGAARRRTAGAAPGAGVIRLGAECTQPHCGALQSDLVSQLQSREAVVIEAAEVRRIDFSSLQLLAAFVRDREAQGRATTWGTVAAPVLHAARRLAMHAMLGLPGSAETRP